MNPHDYFDPSKPSHSYDLKRRQAGAFFRKDREQEEQEAILNIRSLTVEAKDATAESRLKEVELRKLELEIEHREQLLVYTFKEIEFQGVEQRLEAKALLIEVLNAGLAIEEKRLKTEGKNYVLEAEIVQYKVQVDLAVHNSKLAEFEVEMREKLLEVNQTQMKNLDLLNQARLQEKENEIDRKIVFNSQQNQATLEEARKLALEAEYSRKAQGLEFREGSLKIGQMQNDLSTREAMLKLGMKEQDIIGREQSLRMGSKEQELAGRETMMKLDLKGLSLDQKLGEIDKQLVLVKKEQQVVYETYLKSRSESEKAQIERHYANLKSDQAVFEQAKIIQEGEIQRSKVAQSLAEVKSLSASERERLTDKLDQVRTTHADNKHQILLDDIKYREDMLTNATLLNQNKLMVEKATMLKQGAETIYKANQAETRARKAYNEAKKSKISELNTLSEADNKIAQEKRLTNQANNRAHAANNQVTTARVEKQKAEIQANNQITLLKKQLAEKQTQMDDSANYLLGREKQAREEMRRAYNEKDAAERYARDVKRGKI